MDKERLLEENKGLVYFTLKKYYPNYRYDEDAIQNGFIGLWKAIENYEEEAKANFATYATSVIRGSIGNEICKDFRRVRIESTTSLNDDSDGEENSEWLECAAVEDEQKEWFETLDEFKCFYKTLNRREKLIIQLEIEAGMTQNEIAQHLGVSKQYVNRLIKKMRYKFNKVRRENND